MTQSLNIAALNSAVAATPFAGAIHHLRATPSTNNDALKAALTGARIGVWIADRQIAGRGRGAHAWHSPSGTSNEPAGLYMTALVAPRIPMQSALQLSLRTAIAVQSAIVATTIFARPNQIDIRWPNDLILNRRKVGGILIDTASDPGNPPTLRYAIVGIGVNLNQLTFPPALDTIATSLRREMASREPAQPTPPISREPLAAAILLALDAEIRALTTSSQQSATSDLSLYSTWITNKRVRVEPPAGTPHDTPSYTGTTAGLNSAGFLIVNGDDGQQHTVLSGGLREP